MTQPERQGTAAFWLYLFMASVALNAYLSVRRISDEALLTQLRTDLRLIGQRKLVAEEIETLVNKRNQLEAVKNSERYSWELERTAHRP